MHAAVCRRDCKCDPDMARIVDESREDYLYPAKWFVELQLMKELWEPLVDRFFNRF
jgi:hypothetical protein